MVQAIQGDGESMEDCVIVLDSSGSMREEGKQAAGEYLLRTIASFVRSSFPDRHYGAYAWCESMVRFGDKMAGGGSRLNPDALIQFTAEHQGIPIILISDGNFAAIEKKTLANLPDNVRISVVMAGADANCTALQKLFGPSRVFESIDAIECVRQLLAQ